MAKRNYRFWQDKKAFTFLETLVAIFVILSGIVAALSLMGQSSQSIRVAENRAIATFLAQEAIEVVVNIRDTNWLASQPWRTDIPSTTNGIVDFDDTRVREAASAAHYCLNVGGGPPVRYAHVFNPPCNTIFNRHLEIIDRNEDIGGNSVDYIEVRAIVDWTEGGIARQVTVVNHLYDWR